MKNSKDISLYFPAIIFAIILIIAISLFFSFFTIQSYLVKTGESIEVKKNIYLAIDRLLMRTGHPLMIYEAGDLDNIIDSGKKKAIIFSSSFDWNCYKELEELIRYENYTIIVFIDGPEDDLLSEFLFNFNIGYYFDGLWKDPDDNESGKNDDIADFDTAVCFNIIESDDSNNKHLDYLEDGSGDIRLIRLTINDNSLVVSGTPLYMDWSFINDADCRSNARLAWSISGALDDEKDGFVILRSKKAAAGKTYHDSGSFFNLFFQNKAAYMIVFSSLALVISGFCVSFPSFGRWKAERKSPCKSIKERFLLEGRFLKKYDALNLYLEPYAERIRAHYHRSGIDNDTDIINHIIKEKQIDRGDIEAFFNANKKIKAKDLLKYRDMTILIIGEKNGNEH
jgi:hypothetical protein